MALFKKHDILNPESIPDKTFLIDLWELPEDVEIPTLTIKINAKVYEAEQAARVEFSAFPIEIRGDQRDIKYRRDYYRYLKEVLKVAYKDSEGLIDEPTRTAIIALMQQQSMLSEYLGEKMMQYFEGKETLKKKKVEEDEKN